MALPNAKQLAAYEAAPEDERVRLLVHLATSGETEDAEQLLKAFPLQGPHAENRRLFVEGILKRNRGNLTGAAADFRAALANDPKLTLVRSELAKTLVQLEENDSAQHHLNLLAAEAPSENEAQGIRAFMDQVSQKVPYKVSAYMAFAPSTNLNNGSRHAKVYSPLFGVGDVDEDNRAKSGLGATLGLNALYNKRLGNDFALVVAGGTDVRIYDDSDFNSYGFSQSLELRRLVQHGHLGMGVVASESLSNEDFGLSYISYGPRVSASLQVTAKNHLSASAVYEWRNVIGSSDNDTNALMIDNSWTHGFDSTLSATLFSGFDRIEANVDRKSYTTVSAGLAVYKEFAHGFTANVTGSYSQSAFDGFDISILDSRKDYKLYGSMELTKRDLNIFGFAPSIQYSYTENFSNNDMFDSRTHAVDMKLTKDF
jgi:outer membrane protein